MFSLLSAIFLGAVVRIDFHGAIFTNFFAVGFINIINIDFNTAIFAFDSSHSKILLYFEISVICFLNLYQACT